MDEVPVSVVSSGFLCGDCMEGLTGSECSSE